MLFGFKNSIFINICLLHQLNAQCLPTFENFLRRRRWRGEKMIINYPRWNFLRSRIISAGGGPVYSFRRVVVGGGVPMEHHPPPLTTAQTFPKLFGFCFCPPPFFNASSFRHSLTCQYCKTVLVFQYGNVAYSHLEKKSRNVGNYHPLLPLCRRARASRVAPLCFLRLRFYMIRNLIDF